MEVSFKAELFFLLPEGVSAATGDLIGGKGM